MISKWRDLILFAIFEIEHFAAEQGYFLLV